MSSASHFLSNLYALLHVNLLDCLTTIFLCTWVAYHPNVPNPDEPIWKSTSKRVGQAIAGLLSPEGVLMSALCDRVYSRKALRWLKDNDLGLDWTYTHASFAYMGGFQIRNPDGTDGKVLYHYEFFERVIGGEIQMPDIKVKEINDRSKTDLLGKFIVVMHTLWFVVKFIFGPISSNTTLPLGFITLSLVLINILCYVCWWNKPTNVQVSVPVWQKEPLPRESASPAKEASEYRRDESDPEKGQQAINRPPPSKEGFWSYLLTILKKLIFLLLFTTFGVIPSGLNFLALIFGVFDNGPEVVAWIVASAIVFVGALILFPIVFSIITFRQSSRLPTHNGFWTFVRVTTIIVSCGRLCLLVLAIIALRFSWGSD